MVVPYRNFPAVCSGKLGKKGFGRPARRASTACGPSVQCLPSNLCRCLCVDTHGVHGQSMAARRQWQWSFRLSTRTFFAPDPPRAGGVTGVLSPISFCSQFFNRHRSTMLRVDIEMTNPTAIRINHGRFPHDDRMGLVEPDDALGCRPVPALSPNLALAVRSELRGCCTPARWISWGIGSFTIVQEMDHACAVMDEMLGPFHPQMPRAMGTKVIVTADHGQDTRGHHGGARRIASRKTALYYFW